MANKTYANPTPYFGLSVITSSPKSAQNRNLLVFLFQSLIHYLCTPNNTPQAAERSELMRWPLRPRRRRQHPNLRQKQQILINKTKLLHQTSFRVKLTKSTCDTRDTV